MRVDVLRPRELGVAELDRWRSLQGASTRTGTGFVGPDFALALDRVRPDTRVAVLQSGGTVIGFLGFHDLGRGDGRPLGMGLADANALLLAADVATSEVLDPRALVRACGLRTWSFDHLLATEPAWTRWQHRVEPSPVLDLSEGWEAYTEHVRARSASAMSTSARKRRGLERALGPVRLTETRDPELLSQLLTWKSAQYRATGQWDRFAVPWIRALVHDLLQQSTEGAAPLSVLTAGDTVVAAHLGVRTRHRLAWWFPAYDPAVARHSPGVTLLLALAEDACGRGIAAIDLGKGQEDYKGRFATGFDLVREGWVPAGPKALGRWHARRLSLQARASAPPGVKRAARGLVERVRRQA